MLKNTRKILLFISFFIVVGYSIHAQEDNDLTQEINHILDDWHLAATRANADNYFSFFDTEAVFVGTDASEVWSFEEFYAFAFPYFEKGKAWEFRPQSRHIYVSEDRQTVWFNEVLDSDHMGLCRGSGTLIRKENQWKLQQFVLSILVPNQHVNEVLQLKKETENNTQK